MFASNVWDSQCCPRSRPNSRDLIKPVGLVPRAFYTSSPHAHPLTTYLASYLLSTCTFTPLYGRLCTILGRRAACQTALLVTALGTLLCGVSGGMVQLTVARFVRAPFSSLVLNTHAGVLISGVGVIDSRYGWRCRPAACYVSPAFRPDNPDGAHHTPNPFRIVTADMYNIRVRPQHLIYIHAVIHNNNNHHSGTWITPSLQQHLSGRKFA